jgi:hypothetical protein
MEKDKYGSAGSAAGNKLRFDPAPCRGYYVERLNSNESELMQ